MTTARDLYQMICSRYASDKGFVVVPEVGDRTGGHTSRHIDAMAVNLWPSKYAVISFEIKVSTSDWRKELDDPTKRAAFEMQSNEFVFVAPKGIIPKHEVPEGLGLLETHGSGLRWTIRPKFHRDRKPSPDLFMALLRAVDKSAGRLREQYKRRDFARFAGRDLTIADIEKLAQVYAPYSLTSQLSRYEDAHKRILKDREYARGWAHKWNDVVTQLTRALGLPWDPTPAQVRDAMGRLRAQADMVQTAKQIRQLADLLDPPKETED